MRRQLDGVIWGRLFRQYCTDSGQSIRKAAKAVGVPKQTAHDRVKAADTADAYPFMDGWKAYRVLEAREHLEALPDETRETMAEMLSEPGVPPKIAISMLANVREKPRKEQREITRLYGSKDDRERSLAKTKAVELPPSPDRRLIELMQVERSLRACVKWYPDDPLVPALRSMIEAVQELQKAIKAQQEARQNGS